MKSIIIRDKIFNINKQLHDLSEVFANFIEYDEIDIQYLSDKFTTIKNTVNHIEGQIKYIKKK